MKQAGNTHINKEDFQLERLAFFSDAVFAIAITLLIIEIKVPETEEHNVHAITNHDLIVYLMTIIAKMIGFFVSFFVIGIYWVSHHRLFGYINHFHQKLVWANLLFLLPIIIMPFSTAFLSEYYSPSLQVPFIVYTANIVFTGLMSFRLWKIATSREYNLSTVVNNPTVRNYNLVRSLATPLVFVLVLLLSFLSGWISFVLLPLLPFVSAMIKRYYRKKYPSQMAGHLG